MDVNRNLEGVLLETNPSIEEEIKEYNESSWGLVKFLSGPVFNLLNVILGAGVLGLPFAFSQSGFVIGIILLIIVGLATLFSFYFLLWSSEVSQMFTFRDLAKTSMGIYAGVIVDIIIILDTFGTLAAYHLIVGDSLYTFLSSFVSISNPIMNPDVLISISLILIIPLCLLKTISWLELTSFLSIIPLAYLLLLQIIFLGINGSPGGANPVGDYTGFFLALPIFIFSYSSQSTLYPIYNNLKTQGGTYPHMKGVIISSITISGILYILCALLGVMAYPTNTNGNIMLNLPKNGAVDVLLITMAISIIFSFPVILWPMRESADQIVVTVYRRCRSEDDAYDTNSIPTSPKLFSFAYLRFALESILFIGISMGIAMGIPSFVTILGLSGSITKMIICYLLPPIFYLMLGNGSVLENKRKWGAILLLLFGSFGGMASAIVTIYTYVNGVPSGGELITNGTDVNVTTTLS